MRQGAAQGISRLKKTRALAVPSLHVNGVAVTSSQPWAPSAFSSHVGSCGSPRAHVLYCQCRGLTGRPKAAATTVRIASHQRGFVFMECRLRWNVGDVMRPTLRRGGRPEGGPLEILHDRAVLTALQCVDSVTNVLVDAELA